MTEHPAPLSLQHFTADVPPGHRPIGWGHLTADPFEVETTGRAAAAARMQRQLTEELRTTVPDVAVVFRACDAALHREVFLADGVEDDHVGMIAIAHEEHVHGEYEAVLVGGPADGRTVTARADRLRLVVPHTTGPALAPDSTITELTYERQLGHPRRFSYVPGDRT
ncbi:hypothetical protein [Streptomonospora litoralis]|uniref:Uncharacterized protein n=1 Tax=Streptomonospora litoralis TaxID=2498135 RepID=A0A4P6Q3H6_9ACTN|nr:hypothetical protein [Streptomonospora litoralis]QBI53449.1 hypothetical protein EKD16_08275 [Streptomonospora litoralis]